MPRLEAILFSTLALCLCSSAHARARTLLNDGGVDLAAINSSLPPPPPSCGQAASLADWENFCNTTSQSSDTITVAATSIRDVRFANVSNLWGSCGVAPFPPGNPCACLNIPPTDLGECGKAARMVSVWALNIQLFKISPDLGLNVSHIPQCVRLGISGAVSAQFILSQTVQLGFDEPSVPEWFDQQCPDVKECISEAISMVATHSQCFTPLPLAPPPPPPPSPPSPPSA